jgi:hypothetical protein
VIGVVADVRKTLVAENPPDLYVPIAQRPPILAELVVTGAAGLERLDAVRAAVWRVNPELPLNEVRRLDEDVALASLPARFLAWLLSGFALFAVVLATLALYGVVAFAVTERRREIAVRMALGADARAVVRLFLRQATVLVAAGMAAGLAGGFALSRILRSQLFGVAAGDLTTYAGVALALGAAAFAATWVPARRAAGFRRRTRRERRKRASRTGPPAFHGGTGTGPAPGPQVMVAGGSGRSRRDRGPPGSHRRSRACGRPTSRARPTTTASSTVSGRAPRTRTCRSTSG